jgi:DNA-binding CsgD family transcriptional regulator
MRQWTPQHSNAAFQVVEGLIATIGEPAFENTLLQCLQPVVPAASYSIYQTGSGCAPRLYMSASLGVPDTTRDCWRAYMSGPQQNDRTLTQQESTDGHLMICHITAQEAPLEHRTRVYEAHGVAERVSVVRQEAASVFAVNFYRHTHQAPFRDSQLSEFGQVASGLIALAQKQITLSPQHSVADGTLGWWHRKLARLQVGLTVREIEVCARIVTGMTHDGIASDLALSVPTVKTYRNRAFARMGIHFRNELFALLHAN